MNVNELIGKVIEFAGKVTETDYDFDPKQRAKIIAVQDTNDNFGTLKLTLDFKEFAEYNKQFANHDYFDKDQKATLAWHETPFYPKDFRYDFFADRKQIENDTIEFVVLDELSLKIRVRDLRHKIADMLTEEGVQVNGVIDSKLNDLLIKELS